MNYSEFEIGQEQLASAESLAAQLSRAESHLVDANHLQADAALNVVMLRHACVERQRLKALEAPLAVPVLPAVSTLVRIDFSEQAIVYIVDHDAHVRAALRQLLEVNGLRTEVFADGAAFLLGYRRRDDSCLLADTGLVDLKGLALLLVLGAAADPMPVIMITDSSDVVMAVEAIKAGAVDFIEKPIGGAELIASVMRALAGGRTASSKAIDRGDAQHHLEGLTGRQRQILALVLAGNPSKNIASDLGISQRTVENHRAAIMRKSGSKSLPALARLALLAGGDPETKN